MIGYWFIKLAEIIEARIAEMEAHPALQTVAAREVLREVAAALRKVAAS